MLILTRKAGESLVIANNIVVNVIGVNNGQVRLSEQAPQAFAFHQYWSSTQKNHAATAWLLGMNPWGVPDTNWVSKEAGFRPVKVLKIKAEAFIHSPATDIATNVAVTSLPGLIACPAVEEVLERFVNEDTGRFYGRTEELLAELARIGAEARP